MRWEAQRDRSAAAKPTRLERSLLQWSADCYFALRQSGFDPGEAGRILIEVLRDRLENSKPNPDPIRKEPDMRVSETYGGNTLTAEDMPNDGMRVTIRRVIMKTFEDNGRERDKLVLHFEETTKSLVLNKTNADIITEMYGDETDDWEGQAIDLYRTKVEFNGKRVPAIRVRERKARPQPQSQPTKRVVTQQDADEMDDTPF